MIDKLFIECEKLADKYETNLLSILDVYTTIERQQKINSNKYDLKTIIKLTDEYYKDNEVNNNEKDNK